MASEMIFMEGENAVSTPGPDLRKTMVVGYSLLMIFAKAKAPFMGPVGWGEGSNMKNLFNLI